MASEPNPELRQGLLLDRVELGLVDRAAVEQLFRLRDLVARPAVASRFADVGVGLRLLSSGLIPVARAGLLAERR